MSGSLRIHPRVENEFQYSKMVSDGRYLRKMHVGSWGGLLAVESELELSKKCAGGEKMPLNDKKG